MRKTLLAALAAATLVAGCGVQPTGVIPAGPGPSIRATTGPAVVGGGLTLYFVSDGRVIPVTRPSEGFISPEGAITLLMKGPTEREAAQGLTTFIPPEVGRVEVYSGQPGTMVLPFTTRKLSSQALNQLVCTAIAASPSTGQGPVAPGMNLTSPDGDMYYQTCKAG
ncbi:GerMN domain-containing protein [Amycolatopsis sp. cmx-11-12]|uniref:GerMN domain-containing protein n=1 Tax=Amycolatopsis sp. cmx-11-12 TaxID=2785795 RepID=UPI0039174033